MFFALLPVVPLVLGEFFFERRVLLTTVLHPSQLQFNRVDTWDLDQGCINPVACLLGLGQMER